jgi:hypothetical protein
MGGIDYELNGTGNASPEKKKILSLTKYPAAIKKT